MTTQVVCLKGRLHIYGARLEHATNLTYVGRACTMGGWRLPRSIWANPFTVKQCGSAQAAVDAFDAWFADPAQAWLRARLPELVGRQLGCWCAPGAPCHARSLAGLADGLRDGTREPDGLFALPSPRRSVENAAGAGARAGAR